MMYSDYLIMLNNPCVFYSKFIIITEWNRNICRGNCGWFSVCGWCGTIVIWWIRFRWCIRFWIWLGCCMWIWCSVWWNGSRFIGFCWLVSWWAGIQSNLSEIFVLKNPSAFLFGRHSQMINVQVDARVTGFPLGQTSNMLRSYSVYSARMGYPYYMLSFLNDYSGGTCPLTWSFTATWAPEHHVGTTSKGSTMWPLST